MSTRWLILAAGGLAFAVFIAWLASRYPSALDGGGSANLLYYVMLLLVVGSGVLFGRRMGLRFAVKSIAAWVLIGLALILGYSFRFELGAIKDRVLGEVVPHAAQQEGGVISVRLGGDGHYHLEAQVNGRPVRFLVDTGASDIVLSPADARRVGIDPAALDYDKVYSTANGTVRGASVRLAQMDVAGLRFENVRASVNEARMGVSLLGMSFLDRFAGYEVRDGVLRLYP